MRFLRLGLVAVLTVLVLSVGSAGAHSEVFERAPASGQVVTGSVDHVDISFWTAVNEGEITLIDPNGDVVDSGPAELAPSKRVTSIEFEPLTVEGRYTVNHVETSVDGDVQEGTFSFVYNASDGTELASLVARSTGPNWVLLGGISGVILVLVGIFWPGRRA